MCGKDTFLGTVEPFVIQPQNDRVRDDSKHMIGYKTERENEFVANTWKKWTCVCYRHVLFYMYKALSQEHIKQIRSLEWDSMCVRT